jgi:Kef-type K+ transport system membrane component KefB
MFDDNLVSSMFIIFTGASILATVALYARQAVLIAYIVLGILIGPNGLGLISDSGFVDEISDIGIIFLLFLLGLNLHPQSLLRTLSNTAVVTIVSSLIYALIGFQVAYFFSFSFFESLLIGACMMFSSTILGLKLLPTTVLHQQRMGEIVISILLLQDLIAIALLLLCNVSMQDTGIYIVFLRFMLELPGLIAIAFLLDYFILNKLFYRFDRIKEYIFLLAIGWCLGITELSHMLGLSHEIGAFIAGIIIARNKIALFISENLKPLRDFFLVMFFFALGAKFDYKVVKDIIVPAVVLVFVLMLVKPYLFQFLLSKTNQLQVLESHKQKFNKEIGVRLGQLSEFSLLLIYVASSSFSLSNNVLSLVLTATVLSFIVSSYWIIKNYQTPLATCDELRRD